MARSFYLTRKQFWIYSLLLATTTHAQSVPYGGKLKPEQANVDIKHYTIALTVNLPDHSIQGNTTISFNALAPAPTLLFDLMDSLTVTRVWVNKQPAAFTHDSNFLRITPTHPLPAGPATVKVTYGGRPVIAKRPPWSVGFTFTQDSTGAPWMAITAEGTGGKIYFPCKDHPSDEPDQGVDLLVTVPKNLVVAGPGLLQSNTTKGNTRTFHWKTQYPINNYNIVFNIGRYTVVTRNYTTINGHHVPMQFYVLNIHATQAPHLLQMMEQAAHIKEKYFGEYPWWKEKIGLVETPHMGMEHQTMNAYGNRFRYKQIGGQDYDGLMNHEFGHEWWGNKVTASDWADYWIHEGIGSFGDVLYTRDLEGENAYEKNFQQSQFKIHNEKPIVLGKDIEEDQAYHPDIYTKGAFFMHTLRYVIGDSIFFPTLKQLATDPQYNLTSTDAIEKLFSKASAQPLAPLFDLYLRTTQKLHVNVRQTQPGIYTVRLTNIDLPLPLDITTSNGTSTVHTDKKGITINSGTLPVIDAKAFYLKEVTYD